MFLNTLSVLAMVFGFGFVIFFHELGHFLAAKWADVKVEQFAVGFGPAILAWRKGFGMRFGTTTPEYEQRVKEHLQTVHKTAADEINTEKFDQAARELGISETEYRLNWIPLGGYVKMTGQDDLKPGVTSDDPRAYNRKSIARRMVIVSAGVIMNVILAAILFMALFLYGFKAQAAIAGSVLAGSPAQKAGVHTGDRIVTFDSAIMHDWTKILLSVALVQEGTPVPMEVKRAETGLTEKISITALRDENTGFLALGIAPPQSLKAPTVEELFKDLKPEFFLPDTRALGAGDKIVMVNGERVDSDKPVAEATKGQSDYYKLDRALQQDGKKVQLTIADKSGALRTIDITPRMLHWFGKDPLNIAGMVMRPSVKQVLENSPVKGQILPGDVLVELRHGNDDRVRQLSGEKLLKTVNEDGAHGSPITLTVLHSDGKTAKVTVVPSFKLEGGKVGMGIGLAYDDTHAVAADVLPDSPAARAGIPSEATIVSVNGEAVASWFDVRRLLLSAKPGDSIAVVARTESGQSTHQLKLGEEDLKTLASITCTHDLLLDEQTSVRKTKSPLEAAKWGVAETRDFILQFYVTLRRMVEGSVSPRNMMGPVGMFWAGSKFAIKGNDWLIWFLAVISANLAVVNFLPIPIVDGGLFTFLIIEKIQGKPLSHRTQSIAQTVGFALIIGMVLFVTYQDIFHHILRG